MPSSSALAVHTGTRPCTGLLSSTAAVFFRNPQRSKSQTEANFFAGARASSAKQLEDNFGFSKQNGPLDRAHASSPALLQYDSDSPSRKTGPLQPRQRVFAQPASVKQQVSRHFEMQEATASQSSRFRASATTATSTKGFSKSAAFGGAGARGPDAQSGSPTRSGCRPSTTARRENSQGAWVANRLTAEASSAASGSRVVAEQTLGDTVGGGIGESMEAMIEAFQKGYQEITSQFDDAYSSIRLEHLQENTKGTREAKARKAEQRRLEEKLRRARAKEAEMKDPKKKVALKLEIQRTANKTDSEKSTVDIPLKSISVTGSNGPEMVPMVDVLKLQEKCTGMYQGVSVAGLLERAKFGEQLDKVKSSTIDTDTVGSENFADTTDVQAKGTGFLSLEDRQEQAQQKKEAQAAAKVLRCFSKMRSEIAEDGPHIKSLRMKMLAAAKTAQAQSGEDTPQQTRIVSDEWGNILDAVHQKLHEKDNKARFLQLKRRRKTPPKRIFRSGKVHDNFDKVRTVVWLLVLFFKVRKRNRSMEIVKAFTEQLGEWARIRNAVTKFHTKIRLLQGKCKEFLYNKRRRCALMEEKFQRIEDTKWPRYFTAYSKRIMQQRKDDLEPKKIYKTKHGSGDQEANNRAAFYEEMSRTVKIDWENFKIPSVLRKVLISRLYMLMLRKRARMQGDFMTAALKNLRSQKETTSFLTGNYGVSEEEATAVAFHAGMYVVDTGSTPFATSTWWMLSDEMAYELMAFAAYSLIESSVASGTKVVWAEHPCCKDNPGNVYHRTSWAVQPDFSDFTPSDFARAKTTDGGFGNDTAVVQIIVARLDLPRLERALAPKKKDLGTSKRGIVQGSPRLQAAKKNQTLQKDAIGKHVKSSPDFDEVMNMLTPRLRDICDFQAEEYRSDEPARRKFIEGEGIR